jgi:peptide deformylase
MKKRVYISLDPVTREIPAVLITVAKVLSFPLTEEDRRDIQILEQQYDSEDNCAGLAAPQIGISKQVIVFSAPEDPQLKKWRKDFTQTMEKTIWINPSYEALGEKMHEDYEGCFSTADLAGPVKRYCKIRYKAYTVEGVLVEGIAEGFLARIMQHEIDHVHGKLFIDYVPADQLLTVDEYRKKRAAAMTS